MRGALVLDRFPGTNLGYHDLDQPTDAAVESGTRYVIYGPKEFFWSSAMAERVYRNESSAADRANQLRLISLTSAIDQPIPMNWSKWFVEDLQSLLDDSHVLSSVPNNVIVEISADSKLGAKLDALEARWRQETSFLSSITAKVENQWYQEIIALGPQVIPFLLRKLRQKPDYWFDALRKLTLENPIRNRPEIRGDLRAMADCWIAWGEERGYF